MFKLRDPLWSRLAVEYRKRVRTAERRARKKRLDRSCRWRAPRRAVAVGVLGLLLALPLPLTARDLQIGFICDTAADFSLSCASIGLDTTKRAPEWTVRVDGKQVDRARGWRVVLFPLLGRRNDVTLRAFPHGRGISLSHSWGKDP